MNSTRVRTVLLGALPTLMAGAFALLSSTVALGQQKEFSGVTLRVNGFGGDYDKVLMEHVAKPLKEKYDLNVIFTPGSTSADAAKLISSKDDPPYDIFIADSPLMPMLIKAGVIQQVSEAEVPELKRVRPQFRQFGSFGVPFTTSAVIPLYNTAHTAPVATFSDLGRPNLKGKVAFQNPSSTAGALTLVALAEENGGSIDNMEPGFRKLEEMKANLVGTPTATVNLLQFFQNGEAWAGSFWDGRVAAMKKRGVPVEMVVPRGGIYSVVTYANPVVKSKHPKAVAAYLRQALSDEALTAMAAALAYPPTTDVKVPPDVAKTLLVYGDDRMSIVKPMDWEKFARLRSEWLERFNKIMR